MDEEIERLVISVRADTAAFARDVGTMRGELEGPLAAGAGRAGKLIENALSRALTTGKLGFDDLKKIALSAMAEIASASLRGLFGQPGGGQSGGIGGLLSGLVSSLVGAPGRATGGPVSAGRPYLVGERGPELFRPGTSGSIEPGAAAGVTVNVRVDGGAEALLRSEAQIAQALARAVSLGARRL